MARIKKIKIPLFIESKMIITDIFLVVNKLRLSITYWTF